MHGHPSSCLGTPMGSHYCHHCTNGHEHARAVALSTSFKGFPDLLSLMRAPPMVYREVNWQVEA